LTKEKEYDIIKIVQKDKQNQKSKECRNMMKNIYEEMIEEIKAKTKATTWDRAVTAYAVELIENVAEYAKALGHDPVNGDECIKWMLNGVKTWKEYSYYGNSLIYNKDIAKRVCVPYEYERTKQGELAPNKTENWLDVQARALAQACNGVVTLYCSKL
jgi:hypothetical protein